MRKGKVSRRAPADSAHQAGTFFENRHEIRKANAEIQIENLQHDTLDTKAQSYLAKELQRVLCWYEAISLEAASKLQGCCFETFGRVNVLMRDHRVLRVEGVEGLKQLLIPSPTNDFSPPPHFSNNEYPPI